MRAIVMYRNKQGQENRPPGRTTAAFDQRLAAGDESVLSAIVQDYGELIRRRLERRYGHVLTREDLDDVLVTATADLWTHRESFNPRKGSLLCWFFTIALNVARNTMNAAWFRARNLERPLPPANLDGLADTNNSSPGDFETRPGMVEAVRQAVVRLREPYRTIVLATVNGDVRANHAACLAAELDLSPATVRVYRRRALELLRKDLARTLERT